MNRQRAHHGWRETADKHANRQTYDEKTYNWIDRNDTQTNRKTEKNYSM
jgi:hypothetical protein